MNMNKNNQQFYKNHYQNKKNPAHIDILTAGVIHTLKNSLITIESFIELLPEMEQDKLVRDKLAALALKEIENIDQNLQELFKCSDLKAKPAPLGLHEVLKNAVALIQPQLMRSHLACTLELKAEKDLISGDRGLLEQAFINLLQNAIEASSPEGVIRISTNVTPLPEAPNADTLEQVCVTIEDRGCGFTPEQRERIFEPYFTTKIKGTGLGLPITDNILKQHQGHITFQSAKGNGTTVRIKIPVYDDSEKPEHS